LYALAGCWRRRRAAGNSGRNAGYCRSWAVWLFDRSCLGRAGRGAGGWKKYAPHFRRRGAEIEQVTREGSEREREMSPQIIYYLGISREFVRIVASRRVGRRDAAPRVAQFFTGAIDDNAIRDSGGRRRRNLPLVREFRRNSAIMQTEAKLETSRWSLINIERYPIFSRGEKLLSRATRCDGSPCSPS